jgi:2-keto-3-deoxy-L-rhamnonate aldolase RhmA
MRHSRVLEKLRRGGFVVIPTVWIVPHWKVVDVMGTLGFDGVWIENEHSDFSQLELSQMTLACRAHDMDAIVRISYTGYNSIIRVLEAGATGIIVPHCMGHRTAQEVVRHARFAPMGMRGVGGSTDSDYGTVDYKTYFEHANRETLVAVMVEDKEAIAEVDAIAATPGVDVLFVGPADLSQSYGILGQMDHDLIRRAVDATAAACKKHNKWWGMPVNNAEHARQLLAKGARFLAYGDDQAALVTGLSQVRDLANQLKA